MTNILKVPRKWFHPNISGAGAEDLLKSAAAEDGSYLVRPSQSVQGNYALSVRRGEEILHIQIQYTGDCYDLYGGEQFGSLLQLINHYANNDTILKDEQGTEVVLRKELPCKDPTAERWFHGELPSADAEKILLDTKVPGAFLVRTSARKPGDFVLSVRCKEQISHTVIAAQGVKLLMAGQKFDSLSEVVDHVHSNPVTDPFTGEEITLRTVLTTAVAPDRLPDRIGVLSKLGGGHVIVRSGFVDEFRHVVGMPDETLATYKAGALAGNKLKNRYNNILPRDSSRVVLEPLKPKKMTSYKKKKNAGDYINANYVNTSNGETRYIATQGPLQNTAEDFWRMVIQTNTTRIVMLTDFEEQGHEKCFQYIPLKKGSKEKFKEAGIQVDCKMVEKYLDYTVRYLIVTAKNVKMAVTHLQFIKWDNDTRNRDFATRLLEFCGTYRAMSAPEDEQVVVHCSSGLGRTGVFTVLDTILEVLEKNEDPSNPCIDVGMTLHEVRKCRDGLVHTPDQYELIYVCLLEAIGALAKFRESGGSIVKSSENKRVAYTSVTIQNPPSSSTKSKKKPDRYNKPLPNTPKSPYHNVRIGKR